MAGRKRAGSRRGASVEPEQPQSQSSTIAAKVPEVSALTLAPLKIPGPARFPALVALSMATSYGLYTITAPFTSGDLATVSAHLDEWWEIVGILAWKAIELGVGWWSGYDVFDQVSLTLLTHSPYLFFITSFYRISLSTAALCLVIDLVSIGAPFYLLRSSLAAHRLNPPKGSIANRTLLGDIGVQTLPSIFASTIYILVVYFSFHTWMPRYLIVHFEGIKDITNIYRADVMWMVLPFLPIGFAAKTFLFTPSLAAKSDAHDKKNEEFDPETATFKETVLYNIWGHSKRVRTLLQRTGTLVAMSGLHTWLHTYIVVEGAEGFGAAGWASIWVVAAMITGGAFWWVGDV